MENEITFGKTNYLLLTAGLALLALGFLLMQGGGSESINSFNEEIFSFRRITLAPVILLGGYVICLFAILKKQRK